MSRTTDTLLRKALFKELSPGERGELDALLRSSPETRQRLEGLRGTAALLCDLPQETPPHDLEDRIMASLQQRPAAQAMPRWHSRFRGSLQEHCPLFAFLIGAQHLLLGLWLKRMLAGAAGLDELPAWVLLQPVFMLVIGITFLLFGVLFLTRNALAHKISYFGVLLYALFVGFNGFKLHALLGFSQALPGLTAYMGASLLIALFFSRVVRPEGEAWFRLNKRTRICCMVYL